MRFRDLSKRNKKRIRRLRKQRRLPLNRNLRLAEQHDVIRATEAGDYRRVEQESG